jgi:hypothetical protein
MSDQEERLRETPAGARSVPSQMSNRSIDLAQSDPRLEDYLDQVVAPLVGWVPYGARSELRAELQGHLESLVVAYQELGSSPEAAVRAALAQSGDPELISREWVREWERILPPRKAPSAWRSLLVAAGAFGFATNLALGLLVAVQDTGVLNQPWHYGLFYTVLAAVLPFLAGLTTGLLSPVRPARAVCSALVLLIPPTTLVLPWLLRYTPLDVALVIGWLQSLFWIPIGCGAAALGSRLRTRHEEAQRRWALPV